MVLDDKRGSTNCKETTCIMYWLTDTCRFSFQNQTLKGKLQNNSYLIRIERSKRTFPDKKKN
jgi:hypothetical protein